MNTQRLVNWLVACVLICTFSLGCGQKPRTSVSPEQYPVITLGPGDRLDIIFFDTPEMNRPVQVSSSGTIFLELIGEVDVAGKTIHQVTNELEELYRTQLKNPDLTVIPVEMYSNRVYVSGEVMRNGFITMPGPMTVVEAVMESGGFNLTTAAVNNVVVMRKIDGKYKGFTLDLRPALKGKIYTPFYLQQRDVVFIPRKKIASINIWVDQYINRILPQAVWSLVPFVVYREFFQD